MVLGLAFWRLLKNRHKNNLGTEEQSDTQQRPRKAAPAKIFESYDHASDKAHQTAEQFNWKFARNVGAATLIFSIVAAGGTVGAFIETWRQANVAQEALIAGDRPWLEVTVRPVAVTLTPNFNIVTLDIRAKNYGHSPAQTVFAYGETFSEDAASLDKIRALSNVECKKAKRFKVTDLSVMVFPSGEEARIAATIFPNTPAAMHDVWQARRDRDYRALKAFGGAPYADFWTKMGSETPNGEFSVVGCVIYSYGGSFIGETSFSADLLRRCPEGPFGCAFELDKVANYSADKILLKVGSDSFAR